MGQKGAEQEKGGWWLGKCWTAMTVPYSQENLSGKDLDQQLRENWVQARAQSGYEGKTGR